MTALTFPPKHVLQDEHVKIGLIETGVDPRALSYELF
jgi:hypothetical protein